jgi:uncharacterized RDD family membrane protein YckC
MSIIGLPPGPWDPSASGSAAGDVSSTGPGLINDVTIASWGRRAAAYAVDVLVAVGIIGAFRALGHPLPAGIFGSLASGVLLIGYITIAQALTHNTIGKYIMGIQVVSDEAARGLPPLGRIVLRETLGRIASQQFFLGYWFARHDPKRQAWSDQMADTVVVMRPTKPTLRWALIAGTVVTLLGAYTFVGYASMVKQRKATALAQQIRVDGVAIDRLGLNIESLRRQGRSLADLQENNRKVLPLLDQYDQTFRHIQATVLTLLQEKLAAPAAVAPLEKLSAYCATSLEQSAAERQQAELILSYDARTPSENIRRDLAPLNAEILRLGAQRASQQIAIQAGVPAGRQK